MTSRLLTLITAAVMPLAISAAFLIGMIETQVRESKEQELLSVVRALSGSFDAELKAAARFAEALAATENVARGDFARFDSGIRRMLATQPQYTSIVVTDLASGTYLAHTGLPPGAAGPAGPVAMEQSREVAAMGKTVIFGVRPTGPTISDPIIPIRAPIFRDGKVAQTLTVTLSPDYFADIFRQARFNLDRTVSVVDPTLSIAARNRLPEQFIGRKVTQRLAQEMQAKSEGHIGKYRPRRPLRTNRFCSFGRNRLERRGGLAGNGNRRLGPARNDSADHRRRPGRPHRHRYRRLLRRAHPARSHGRT